MTLHWCGTDARALPGLRSVLSRAAVPVVAWSDDPAGLPAELITLLPRIEAFDPDRLGLEVERGDVIVTFGDAVRVEGLATLAVNKGAHLVTPHPLTPAMLALQGKALLAQSSVVAEVGTSPGLDVAMARSMVQAYRDSPAFDPDNTISLISLAGSLPQKAGPLRAVPGTEAQTLWQALSAPSRAVREFQEKRINLAWDAGEEVTLPLREAEGFEVLPHGDALSLLDHCRIDPNWPVRRLERGLLRPKGWSAAWGPVLSQIETLQAGAPGAPRSALEATGGGRLILCVVFEAERDGRIIRNQSAVFEAVDNGRGTAVARVTGRHVRLAVETMLRSDKTLPGVHAGWQDDTVLDAWLREMAKEATHFEMSHH